MKKWLILIFSTIILFTCNEVTTTNTDNDAVKQMEQEDIANIIRNPVSAEEEIDPDFVPKITFKKEYDEIMGFKVDKPVFSKEVLELEGKVIKIKGYIIPVEGYKSHKEFVFSAFPYNMCFFCGGAGPETVMEVVASEPVKYSAEAVTLEGKLETNSDDINRLIYTLTDAVLIKE